MTATETGHLALLLAAARKVVEHWDRQNVTPGYNVAVFPIATDFHRLAACVDLFSPLKDETHPQLELNLSKDPQNEY